MTKGTANAAAVAVEKSAGEARPPGIAEYCAEHCAMTKSELAEHPDEESSVEAGPSWSRASGTASTAATANSRRVCW